MFSLASSTDFQGARPGLACQTGEAVQSLPRLPRPYRARLRGGPYHLGVRSVDDSDGLNQCRDSRLDLSNSALVPATPVLV